MSIMRQSRKAFLFLILGVICAVFFCEFLLYYIVVAQCSWPTISSNTYGGGILKAFVLADIHMLGPYRGHWLDKWRREWQMHRAYQSIITVHRPDVIFILGDVFDEGEWANRKQFEDYVERFHRYFSVPPDVDLHIVAGNHDIGFHHNIRRGAAERFTKTFSSPSVQLVTAKENHFVLINSMALHGDFCSLCKGARRAIQNISDLLQCSQDNQCQENKETVKYSRPIIMQHFPLFRVSDSVCTEPDAPPLPERNVPFRPRIDALSQEATDYLVHKLKPRAVFGGHTHHGCVVHHRYADLSFAEHSVPSFSWRNRPDPKYLLLAITPDIYELNKCALPTEISIAATAFVLLCTVIYVVTKHRRRF